MSAPPVRMAAEEPRTVDSPRTSVIVPVHDGEAWIRECVESLLDQTAPAHELIVVDDGSTDRTVDAIAGLPVRIIRLDRNTGRASARNAGLTHASGDIVVFAEDDGVYPQRYLERLTAPFADPAVAGAIGPYRVLRPATLIAHCRDAERAIHFSRYSPFTAWAYRTADVRALGGFDERLEVAEDVDLGRRVARECGRIAWVPDALWYHREPASLGRFLRRRFRAGAGSLLDRLRPGRPLVPRRALTALLALPAAGALTAFTAGEVVWLPVASVAALPLLPPLLRARFIAAAPRAGVRTAHAIGWSYLELAGWAAAAAGTVWALLLGPARVQRRLRGR